MKPGCMALKFQHHMDRLPHPSTHPQFGQGTLGLGKQGVFDLLGFRTLECMGMGTIATAPPKNSREVNSYPIPDAPCMEYLPTFTPKIAQM